MNQLNNVNVNHSIWKFLKIIVGRTKCSRRLGVWDPGLDTIFLCCPKCQINAVGLSLYMVGLALLAEMHATFDIIYNNMFYVFAIFFWKCVSCILSQCINREISFAFFNVSSARIFPCIISPYSIVRIRTDDAWKNAKLVYLIINCDRFSCCHLCGL